MDHAFDEAASAYANMLDDAIASDGFVRGRLFVEAIRREVPAGARVLDYGCGPGRISRLLAIQGYDVDAPDPSAAMIAEAEKQNIAGLRIAFRHYDGNGDDLETGAYAGIVCSSVIEFVSDPEALLKNFRRALGRDGVLVFSYANRCSLVRAYATLLYRNRLRHLTLQYHLWTFRDARAALERSGFRPVAGPVFFEASPFDKRPGLQFLSSSAWFGMLGLVTARPG
jgi:2-polyprenyl-3-methyl-5-hydroxy-6-metoxy-1,4-benzoquinol methylase